MKMRVILLSNVLQNIAKMKLLEGAPDVDKIIVCDTIEKAKEIINEPSELKTIVLVDGNLPLDAIFDFYDEVSGHDLHMFVAEEAVRPTIMHTVQDNGLGYVIFPLDEVDMKKITNC